jgi:hypothetical protein
VGLDVTSTTDQIFCIRPILEKKWEYSETVHQLFIDFKKTYDSVMRVVLYNILIEFGVPMKLIHSLMELSLSSEAVNCAATQELPSILWNLKAHYLFTRALPILPD